MSMILNLTVSMLVIGEFREAEVVRGHKGPSPKSLDSDNNLKP